MNIQIADVLDLIKTCLYAYFGFWAFCIGAVLLFSLVVITVVFLFGAIFAYFDRGNNE